MSLRFLEKLSSALLLPLSNIIHKIEISNINIPIGLQKIIVIILTITLCMVPCAVYIDFKKVFREKSMLNYIKAGGFFCVLYTSLLAYLCFFSNWVDTYFPPFKWIMLIFLLLFLTSAIFLFTYSTYDLAAQTKEVQELLQTFEAIVGVTETNNISYNANADTIEELQNNLKILQQDLNNEKYENIPDNLDNNLKKIKSLINNVQESLQEQIDELNNKLKDGDGDVDEQIINAQINALKSNIDEVTRYYNDLPNFLNKNRGQLFVYIMCAIFILIYCLVFIIDFCKAVFTSD